MQAIIEQVFKNINDQHIVVDDVTPLHPMAGTNPQVLTGGFDLWYEDPGQIEERLVSVACDNHGISGFNFDPRFFITGERSIKLVKNIINALSKSEENHV